MNCLCAYLHSHSILLLFFSVCSCACRSFCISFKCEIFHCQHTNNFSYSIINSNKNRKETAARGVNPKSIDSTRTHRDEYVFIAYTCGAKVNFLSVCSNGERVHTQFEYNYTQVNSIKRHRLPMNSSTSLIHRLAQFIHLI